MGGHFLKQLQFYDKYYKREIYVGTKTREKLVPPVIEEINKEKNGI